VPTQLSWKRFFLFMTIWLAPGLGGVAIALLFKMLHDKAPPPWVGIALVIFVGAGMCATTYFARRLLPSEVRLTLK
jgi:drug/metabolite transporter (DMT)-like permease